MTLSKYQKFEPARLVRNVIQDAPYNPRAITASAERRLRENLRDTGLLGPVIVNKRNNRLVGGHMRLLCLDNLERREDYELDVAMVDLDEVQEREQNIFLNNPVAQGQYDMQMLAELVRGPGLDAVAAGFKDSAELERLLPPVEIPLPAVLPPTVQPASAAVESLPTDTTGVTAAASVYMTFVFRDNAERQAFLRAMELDERERYVSSRKIWSLLGG